MSDAPPLHVNVRRKEISDDVEEFLRRGGKIERVEPGVSGMTPKLNKHIRLGTARAAHARKYITTRTKGG